MPASVMFGDVTVSTHSDFNELSEVKPWSVKLPPIPRFVSWFSFPICLSVASVIVPPSSKTGASSFSNLEAPMQTDHRPGT